MLAAFKTEAKQTKQLDGSCIKGRKASSRSGAMPPSAFQETDVHAKCDSNKQGNMSMFLAQPSWAAHLQTKIAYVTDSEQLRLLQEAMLEFSLRNAKHTSEFLQPHECRYVYDPFLCSLGR
jgi:hypothetical protein